MQTYSFADVNDNRIRSSKLGALEKCGFLFWATYFQGIPAKSNSGAEMGTISHEILELLSNPKHRKIYDKIIESNSIYAHAPIKRLVRQYISATQTLKPDEE